MCLLPCIPGATIVKRKREEDEEKEGNIWQLLLRARAVRTARSAPSLLEGWLAACLVIYRSLLELLHIPEEVKCMQVQEKDLK